MGKIDRMYIKSGNPDATERSWVEQMSEVWGEDTLSIWWFLPTAVTLTPAQLGYAPPADHRINRSPEGMPEARFNCLQVAVAFI